MTKDQALQLIGNELDRALAKHNTGFVTNRHGHSVIREEYVEFEDAVFEDNGHQALLEVKQLGAMTARYLMDCGEVNLAADRQTFILSAKPVNKVLT